jgi:hypothetical protein
MYSKEADGATMPFALLGVALFTGAQVARQASLAFMVESDLIQTVYGTLREAATVLVAMQSARETRQRLRQPVYKFFSWARAYIALLV